MVFFVDLGEGEVEVGMRARRGEGSGVVKRGNELDAGHENGKDIVGMETLNLNRNRMTEAFGCYPIISQITSHLDINTLSHLSTTCRQIRANLLQYRPQLLASTLHCTNESLPPSPEHTLRYRARASDWYFVEDDGNRSSGPGKFGECARDMVGQCRRDGCGTIVCRNCTIKPPAPILLHHRHRRLCKICVKAPLELLVTSTSVELAGNATAGVKGGINEKRSVFCTCPIQGIWLCQPCGRGLRSADTTYESIWRWRTSYVSYLGGVGTGIGEGDRGVECGRGKNCLGAREVESETDCDAEDARSVHSDQNLGSSPTADSSGDPLPLLNGGGIAQMGPGYLRHEIEGIGGKVKKKLVTMVKVGACVPQFEDEQGMGMHMAREISGRERSWCGWCWRVVRGEKDYVRKSTKVA